MAPDGTSYLDSAESSEIKALLAWKTGTLLTGLQHPNTHRKFNISSTLGSFLNLIYSPLLATEQYGQQTKLNCRVGSRPCLYIRGLYWNYLLVTWLMLFSGFLTCVLLWVLPTHCKIGKYSACVTPFHSRMHFIL